MVRTVTLSEWPTALAACAAAPIVAVGGASGGVRLAAHPFHASDNALFAPADMVRYLAVTPHLYTYLYTALFAPASRVCLLWLHLLWLQ